MTAIVDGASLPTTLRIRDLGPISTEHGGRPLRLPGTRLASALALLVIHTGRRVGNDALAEAMWGRAGPARSASTLDSHVFRLRQVLEPGRARGEPSTTLIREAGGYRLVVGVDQVDSLRFARLAADAADLLAQGSPDRALRRTAEALGSWRGRPYGDSADEPWAAPAVGRLEELHGQVRETHIDALVATGATERALAELETALAELPLRERLWVARMTAHRDSGRRAEALATYARAREVLVEELGIEPGPELRALHAAVLADDAAPVRTPAPARTPRAVGLPVPRADLVGRDRELAELTELVAGRPLVTLAGPAGVGKTRLAVEVARGAAARFPDGVRFVDLTSATGDDVLDTVCSAVELPAPVGGDPLAGLRGLARDRRMLLVLDNCEHVLDPAADLVERLLDVGGELAVLATSREPLEVRAEVVHRLAPLAIEAAVELFLGRLDAPGPADRAAATDIAAAVDGLPLALELAAGRAHAYSLAEIAAQVREDASSLGRVGRGRRADRATVRDAVDSSYRVLSPAEAALHRAVGVVPGPFTADLAGALVGWGPAETADAVAGLVHRSLLTPLGPARPGRFSRFAQLATVRGHALHQGDRADAARDAWIARLVSSRPAFGSRRQGEWCLALDDDLAALRATLRHTLVDAPTGTGVALAARLSRYWTYQGLLVEGLRWTRAALSACERDPGLGSATDRGLVHAWAGGVLASQGRSEEAGRLVRAGLAAVGGAVGRDAVHACEDLTMITGAIFRGQDAGLLAEIARVVRTLAAGDPALDVLVRHAALVGETLTGPGAGLLDPITTLHDDALAADNLLTAWIAAVGLAQLLLRLGRSDDALTWARTCLAECVELGLTDSTVPVEVLGCALAATGDHPGAARAFALAEAQNARGGLRWPIAEGTAALVDDVAAAVGRRGLEEARAEAAGWTLADLAAAHTADGSTTRTA